jgi:DeoR/GlpR family transcriptional regulator of sugar metabolism
MALHTPPTEKRRDGPPAARGVLPALARRRMLQAAIAERGFVSVVEIAREMGMSEMTVRRDLDALQQLGAVQRSHGGAVAALPVAAAQEPSFDAREHVRVHAKRAIAAAALRLIGDREVIGLDVGSTVACLASLLRGRAGLGIVTNSLRVVSALCADAGPTPDVYMLGGQLRAREGSLCGAIAQRQLADHWLNKAFIGTAGLCEDGLFDYSMEETQLTMGYIRSAAEVIVLCDSSKFGLRGFARVCGLEAVTRLITDAEPPAPLRATLERAGTTITIAEPLMSEST